MLQRLGLTSRLMLIGSAVLAAGTTICWAAWRQAHTEAFRRQTERSMRPLVHAILDRIEPLDLSGDLTAARQVFARAVGERREFAGLALWGGPRDDSVPPRPGPLAARIRERSFAEELGPTSLDRSVMESDQPRLAFVTRGRETHAAFAYPFTHRGEKLVLHAELPVPELDEADRQNAETLVVVTLAMLVVAAFFFALFVRYAIERPIGVLSGAISGLRGASVGRTLPVRQDDQFGLLIRNFNEMSLDLRSWAAENRRLTAQLEKFNQELEKRVEEATHELKARNQELEETQGRLIRIQQEVSRLERLAYLGELSSALAHELATPLNVILGHLEILEREVAGSERSLERTRIISRETHRLVGILKQTHSSVRPPEPRRETFSLNTLVDEAVRFMQPTLAARGVTVEKVLPTEDVSAVADYHQAHQVILNLITNAMAAMPEGGTITITVSRDGGRAAQVAVRDTGPGIAPDALERIFDPFFTTRAPGGGLGLGLSISRDIMRRNEGAIAAANPPGGGAEFRLTFPAP